MTSPKTPADALLLKACPFCGGKAKHEWRSADPCWIECEACGAVGPNDAETTTEQNEAAWNTRTPPPGEDQAAEGALAPDQLADIVREAWGSPVMVSDMEAAVELLVAYERHRPHPATPEKAAERGDLRAVMIQAANNISDMLDDGVKKHRDRLITLADALRDAALAQPAALSGGECPECEEMGRSGEADGYCKAMAEIDRLTSGDGEYRYCTVADDGHCPDPESMKAKIVERFATLTSPPPQGWRMVPVEPTAEMIAAWSDAAGDYYPGISDEDCNASYAKANWSAMLAAAPLSTAPAPSLGSGQRAGQP